MICRNGKEFNTRIPSSLRYEFKSWGGLGPFYFYLSAFFLRAAARYRCSGDAPRHNKATPRLSRIARGSPPVSTPCAAGTAAPCSPRFQASAPAESLIQFNLHKLPELNAFESTASIESRVLWGDVESNLSKNFTNQITRFPTKLLRWQESNSGF